MTIRGLIRRVKLLMARFRQADDRQLVQGSGLFDAPWYLDKYPDVKSARQDPLEHFLSFGCREGRDPGPGFSTVYYLEHNPDSSFSDLPPIFHFLRVGVKEGRKPMGDNPRGPAYQPLPDPPVLPLEFQPRVGFVLHAYYPDLIYSFLESATLFPAETKIYIGVPTIEAGQIARNAVQTLGLALAVEIKLSENRGRNFGTLTSLFGPQLLAECDLICHVHTKKSLYTGKDQFAWREQLLKSLLSDREYVQSILGLFDTNPKLGIISPYPMESVAYYLYSDCLNSKSLEKLYGTLEVPGPFTRYYDFPAGGMFWARTAAIRQLIDGRIRYEDYEEEPCGVDGSLAHAVERSIIHLASQNGYEFIEIDGEYRVFACNFANKNLNQYTTKATRENFRSLARRAKVISFGFEDTLFTLSQNLKAFEPRGTVIEELKHLAGMGKRLVVITSGGHSLTYIQDTIEKLGLPNSISIYASKDLSDTESESSFWPEFLRREKVRDCEVFHFGSHPMFDYHFPTLAGISAFLILRAVDLLQLRTEQRVANKIGEEVRIRELSISDFSDPFEGR